MSFSNGVVSVQTPSTTLARKAPQCEPDSTSPEKAAFASSAAIALRGASRLVPTTDAALAIARPDRKRRREMPVLFV